MSESKEQWLIAEMERLTKKREQLLCVIYTESTSRAVGNNSMRGNGCTGEVLTMAINEVRQ